MPKKSTIAFLCVVYKFDSHPLAGVSRDVFRSLSQLDPVDPLSELERAERFPDLFHRRRHRGEEQRFGITAEGVLKQSGDLGVAVWDVPLLGGDGVQHLAKGGQGFVDELRFLKTVA